ncbi:MAG TPA: sulfotransferase [Gammaproteobacteria bacterium]|nr:sulfotransferase [Gammaproteobacteria bacterium]
MPSDKTFVFVAGLHHSGTSLLHRLLGAHPEISAFSGTGVPEDEGQHLQSLIPPALAYGGPARFGFDPRARLDETSPLATPLGAEKLYGEWAPHWDLEKRLLIEKSPPTLVRLRFFQALFPHSVFVVILRHPIALAVATRRGFVRYTLRNSFSVGRRGGKSGPAASAPLHLRDLAKLRLRRDVEHTLICYEQAFRDLGHIDRAFVLRYEDFVADPNAMLRRVFRFLGVAPVEAAEAVRRDVNARYVHAWRRGLLAPLRARIAARFEERARAVGYSLVEPARQVPLSVSGSDVTVAEGPAAGS